MSDPRLNRDYELESVDSPARRYDGVVLLLVGTLMTLGAVMVYSAAMTAESGRINWRDILHSPLRQCIFSLVGFGAMLWMSMLDYRLWAWERRGEGWSSGLLFLVAVGLVILMLIPGIGETAKGARRAIPIPGSPIPISFQPAEFAKVVMIVWLAALLSRPNYDARSFKQGYLPGIVTAGAVVLLVAIQDFGTAALMGVIAVVMMLAAGVNWLYLLATVVIGGGGGGWLLIKMYPYRVERILTFFSDNPDPSGAAYQVNQSLIAISSGGWFGRGLGAGVQKLGYLPQGDNDFIFSIVCEELGIVGGMFVIALFVLLLARGWWISSHSDSPFGRLLAVGITIMICLQAAFNIGVVTNSVPTKGISLPFVSAGGSGVLFLGLAAGLLASIGGRVSPTKDDS